MKIFDDPGVCEKHGCELTRVPQVYCAPYYVCKTCEEETVAKLAASVGPVDFQALEKRCVNLEGMLKDLEQAHIDILHELGEARSNLKKAYEQLKKAGL